MNEKAAALEPVPQTPVPELEDGPRRKSVSYVLWRVLVAAVLLLVGWDALSGLGYGMHRAFRYFHPARIEQHHIAGPDIQVRSGSCDLLGAC